MLKHTGVIIIFIIMVYSAAVQADSADHSDSGAPNSFSLKDEIIEWGIYSSLYASGYMLNRHGPFFDEPLIGGETDKRYKKNDTVPSLWLRAWMGGVYGYIAFTPNNEGFLNEVAYNNTKGFFESVGYSYFITSFTKVITGRKRPSYDNYPEHEKDDSGRESFISGHSSLSFVIAAYSSLFIYEHTGDNSRPFDIALKSTAITASFCAAGFTAWSRIKDNRHHLSDVIAGGTAGIISGVAGYMHQNGLFNRAVLSDNITIHPEIFNETLFLSINKKI